MKKTILFLFLLCLAACTEELDQDPITAKELSVFLTNETEVEEYVNAAYAGLQANGLYGLYLPAFAEIPSDNTFDEVPANDEGMYGQLDEFTIIPSNNIVSTTWRDSYRGIQRTNVVLGRIDQVAYQNEAIRQARKGEMKFIRALLYFNLVRLYGDVPLVTSETKDPNTYFGQGRTPASQVYDRIKQDLAEAIEGLPDVPDRSGKVTRTAAQALLGKVHLTLKEYAAAKAPLDEVVASGRHRLLPKPEEVFAITNENNQEILFAVQFASGINGNTEGSTMFQQFSPSATVSGAKGHNLPTVSLYNLYPSNDLRKGNYVKTTQRGVPFSGKLTRPTTVITDGGSDFVVLRYADVLLMLAEAENELGNATAASGYLNQVRARAGLGSATASTQAGLREAIDLERRLELVGEGHRWFDLLRTGQAMAVMNEWFDRQGRPIRISENNLLMPIPQSQINTDPAITQNSGY